MAASGDVPGGLVGLVIDWPSHRLGLVGVLVLVEEGGECVSRCPVRPTGFPVEPAWSLALQVRLYSPGHVPVPPRVFALIVGPVSRYGDRHVYRHLYRRWDVAINLALQSALHEGLRAGAARGPGPRPGQAGRRERRHPAEASPLGQVRVWTTLFGPFTVGVWERQAPTRGAPSGARCPAGRGGPGPFTPLRCPGLDEGSSAVTNPQKSPRFVTRPLAAGRGLHFRGLVTAHSRGP